MRREQAASSAHPIRITNPQTHVKNIFVKLDVDKRARAVARAQALGPVAAG
jgi:ATP/maltotriose-dependent transcriptional regulator MalT